jgi:outer membrane receptor protein involved in Fe transport
LCASLVLSDLPAALGQAISPATLSADIPAQPLGQALANIARQTGLQFIYVSQIVDKQRSRAVSAGLDVDAALTRMLQGTGLRFEHLTAHSVRILAAPRAAQSSLTADTSQSPVPEVFVTGSRIPVAANITAASPLQVVTAYDILLSGYSDTGDVISVLPQVITNSGADEGSRSNAVSNLGTTTADLRGLGPQRTVVLINGRRLGVGDPNTVNSYPAPDLNQVPLPMVERVEVLTGGASATYGSDAVAGVVNFILKDHVRGVQIDGQVGSAEHTQHDDYLQAVQAAAGIAPPVGTTVDGFTRDLSVLAGTAFPDDRGQISGYFIYHAQNAVHGSDRDFSNCAAYSTNYLTGVPTQPGLTCFGSHNSNQFGTNVGLYSVVGNQFVPWPAAGSLPPAIFNYAPYLTSQRQDTRYQAGLLAHFEFNPFARPYFEFAYMDDNARVELAPSGLFQANNYTTADGAYLVNCSNPLLSAEEAAILCTPAQIGADKAHPGSVNADVDIGRRNIEGGGRFVTYEHRNYRGVVGLDGALGDAWNYDAYALYYYTSMFNALTNSLNYAAIDKALQVTTDQGGRPLCISGGNCVPYDIFTTGAVTARQLAYLYVYGTADGSNSEQIVHADFTGQLVGYGLIAPWAHDGIALNAGAERRTESLRFDPDAAERSGDLAGFGGKAVAIDKSVSVNEGFLEVRVPLAQNQPLTRDLTIGGGYRYSVYTTAGAANTYRFDLQYAPLADVRLRASYNHVVRAPNLIELYTPGSYGPAGTVGTDPCAPTNGGATHAAASLAACLHTAVTAAQYGNGIGPAFGGTSRIVQCVGVCGALSGGNPWLAPETADTWSLGVTLTPSAVPALTGSVDYFHIDLKGAIGTVPASVTLQECLATGDPTWCSQIVRTPSGALSGANVAGGGYILQTDINTGAALVTGTDLQMNYSQSLSARWGALTASLIGSWLQHNSSTPYRSAPSYDCAGLFGLSCLNGSVSPTWRHNLRVTWETPWNAQFSAQWRFIGHTSFDNNSSQIPLQNQEEGFYDPVLTHIPNYSYLDLTAVWAVTRHVQMQAGVNNLFDKDPPFLPADVVGGNSSGINTLPPYDTLGRYIYFGFRATF